MAEAFEDRDQAGIEGLPEVTPAHAAALRKALLNRRFVPSTHRLPDEVLPDPALIRIIDQGQESLSVGVGLAAALNYLRARDGDTRLVSARMLYEFARRYDEWSDQPHSGSSLTGALAALVEHGVCLDSEWPLSQRDRGASPEALRAALGNRPAAMRQVEREVEALRAAVFEHHAVVVAAMIHDGWTQTAKGVITYKRPKGGGKPATMGGHVVTVLGYTSAGFLVQNSWGEAWSAAVVGRRRYPGLAIWSYDDAADNLIDAWILELSHTPFRPPLVGYDADSLDGDDMLEIRAEVEAFSYVLASASIRPPLALGLFGDWGSGKSFFMQAMQRKIDVLTKNEKTRAASDTTPRRFCRNIVQIHFNAWHFLDTDLWASLVTEIFDRLFKAIGGDSGSKPEAQLPKLAAALQDAKGVYQQAQQQLDEARQARGAAEAAMKSAVAARERREGTLATQLDDIAALLSGQPQVHAAVQDLAAALGEPELATSFRTLEHRVGELGGQGRRLSSLLQAMFMTPWGWWRLGTLVAALLVPIGIVAGVEALLEAGALQQPIGAVQSLALQLSGSLAALATWLGAQVRRGTGLVSRLESTHRQLEAIRQRRREAAVADQDETLQTLVAREEAARRSLLDAEKRVQDLQHEVNELQPARLIMRFIEERSRSSDYRSRLGIVSLVRRDFERLSELADPDSKEHNAELMPVERIILYVDDLDRCKPDRVIEVLEAVHLLLAFRLFMVVVAVDPRWLRHCLERHYPDLLSVSGAPRALVAHVLPSRPATAQDYLEKIFQIPFLLQPLKDDGFRRLIHGLTTGSVAAEQTAPVGGQPGSTPTPATSTAATGGNTAIDSASGKVTGNDGTTGQETLDDESSAIERLELRAWEVEDMQRLAPLFRTPRAVKRFVNTYRFLRASIHAHERPIFEGSRESPGTYRAALLLLAVVVNHAAVAPRLLRRISDLPDHGDTSWQVFLRRLHAEPPGKPSTKPTGKTVKTDAVPEATADTKAGTVAGRAARQVAASATEPLSWEAVEWQQLCATLLRLSESGFPGIQVHELQPWVRVVARYSFSLTATTTLLEG